MNISNNFNQNRSGAKQKEFQKNPKFRSKEAQDLMDSLNKIKQMIKTPDIKQLPQQTPTKSTTNSLQNSQVISGSASPYQELQIISDIEIYNTTPQFQLPQPNIQKTMQYFPSSPIEEQNEEDYDTPIANKNRRPQSNSQVGFIKEFASQSGINFFQSAQSSQRIHSDDNVNIYRFKEEENKLKTDRVDRLFEVIKDDKQLFDEELNMQHQELKNLQQTLVKRIDSLRRNMSQRPLTQYIEKENEKLSINRTHSKKTLSAQIQSETNDTTPKNRLIQWTGIPNLPIRRDSLGGKQSSSRQEKKKKYVTQYTGVNVVQVDLKFEKKPKTLPKSYIVK